jgi:hypothetical protein
MGIARKVELYNQAFRLAHEHISKHGDLNDRAGIVADLHDAIRRVLLTGAEDVVAIAAAAIRELQSQPQVPPLDYGTTGVN